MQLKLTIVQKTSSNTWSIITSNVSVYGFVIVTAIVENSLLICFVYHLFFTKPHKYRSYVT